MPSFRRLCLCVALLLALVSAVCLAVPIVEAPINRAIMFDRRIGKAQENSDVYGTRSTLIRGPLVTYTSASESQSDARYRSQTVYVPCGEVLTKTTITRLSLGGIRGLLVAQCPEGPSAGNEEALAMYLTAASTSFPVYVVPPSAQAALDAAVAATSPNGPQAADHLVVAVARSVRFSQMLPNRSIDAVTISSNLIHKRKALKTTSPRVLVTAHFDTLGVAPTALTSAGASGAAAALELWRRALATATDAEAAQALEPHTLSMLIGSTARENYVGTASWLADRKESELEQLKLVICLDELLGSVTEAASSASERSGADGGRTRLFLHLHDTFHRRADGKHVTELAVQLAAAMDIDLKVVTAKTNYQHYDLRFEHEMFANRQLPALTFSVTRQQHLDQLVRGGSAQRITDAAVREMETRVNFVYAFVNAVLHGMDASKAAAAATSTWPGTASYLKGQLNFAATTPRSPLALNGDAVTRYGDALTEHLRQQNAAVRGSSQSSAVSLMHTDHVRLSNVVLYGPYEETLRVFVSKNMLTQMLYAGLALAAAFAFGYLEFGGITGVKHLLFPPKA